MSIKKSQHQYNIVHQYRSYGQIRLSISVLKSKIQEETRERRKRKCVITTAGRTLNRPGQFLQFTQVL